MYSERYEGGLKISYDDVISTIVHFLNNGI